MRPSLVRVRSWFSSTDFDRVSTLSLTWVTSPRTNFFVAQAVVPPSARATTGIARTNFFMTHPPHNLQAQRPASVYESYSAPPAVAGFTPGDSKNAPPLLP